MTTTDLEEDSLAEAGYNTAIGVHMKKILILACAVALCTSAFSTEYSGHYALPASFDKANIYRTDIPSLTAKNIVADTYLDELRVSDAGDYINAVAHKIATYSPDAFDRAKMAHDVTALLLSYDAANYWAGTVPEQTLTYVLLTKKAVCEGYANVFKALCDAIGIQCEKVHGYSRGVGYSNGAYEDPTKSNHAWNIVKLEGAWYIVDCTWDSGHMEGRVSVKDYNTTWLFADPKYFICTHFPTDDATQQLMKNIVSAAGFRKLPAFRPNIADVADLLTFPQKENSLTNGQCVISYKAKNGGKLSVNLKDSADETIFRDFTYTDSDTTNIFVSLPTSGTYKISVFVYKNGSNKGDWGGDFAVTSTVAGSSITSLSDEQKQGLIASTTPFPKSLISSEDTYIASNNTASTYTPSVKTSSKPKHYSDDGFAGLSFNISTKKMLSDIGSGDDELKTFDVGVSLDLAGDWLLGGASFDVINDGSDENDIKNACMAGLFIGRRIFDLLGIYAGGQISTNWIVDKDEDIQYKVNGGVLLPLYSLIALKADASWNSIYGLSFGVGVSFGFPLFAN